MTSQNFIEWLRGFTEGVHEYNITPKQWDLLKERLDQVSDEPKTVYPFGVPNETDYDLVNRDPWGSPMRWGSTSGTGEMSLSGSVSTVSVWTTDNPNGITYTVTSGSAYSGPVTYTYPNGTTVSYTTGPADANEFWNLNEKELSLDHKVPKKK